MTEGTGKTEHPERGGSRAEMKEKEKEKEKEMIVVAGPSRETQISLASSSSFPGFRFSPTDEELISYYLKKKMEGCQKSVEVISEVEICRFEPWDLPAKSIIQSQNEWFFFSSRGRKYPNGSQSRRATELGYWKATGKERNVKSANNVIGTKRTLVFHLGRAPKGERTEWIMHEYCMYGKSQDAPVVCRLRRNSEFRLNDGLNRAPVSQRQPIDVGNSNRAASDGRTDQMGVSDGDKSNMGALARRTSSSYGSHSVEQLDSTSESNQKQPGEARPAESSNHPKDCDGEEDFYADILNDDIIKLDESGMSTTRSPLTIEDSRLVDGAMEPEQSMQAFLAPVPIPSLTNWRVTHNEKNGEEHLPGSANLASALESMGIEYDSEEYKAGKDRGSDWSSWGSLTCVVTTIFAGKTIARQVMAIILVLVLAVVIVCLMGS